MNCSRSRPTTSSEFYNCPKSKLGEFSRFSSWISKSPKPAPFIAEWIKVWHSSFTLRRPAKVAFKSFKDSSFSLKARIPACKFENRAIALNLSV
jgi:hypothetical protein